MIDHTTQVLTWEKFLTVYLNMGCVYFHLLTAIIVIYGAVAQEQNTTFYPRQLQH